MAGTRTKPVALGRIVGLFGIKGWVKVFSYTDPRAAILDYRRWMLSQDGDWRRVRVAEGTPHGKGIVARIDGIDDRDAAAGLVGCEIAVRRDEMPDIGPGRYYWTDLEGMRVVHRDGKELGTVAQVLETGANDVLVTAGAKERLIPFVLGTVILDVDTANGVITVDWEWD